MRKYFHFIFLAFFAIVLTGCAADIPFLQEEEKVLDSVEIREGAHYTEKDEVAAYIDTFGHLPANYITKEEAMELGWEANEGNLWEVTDEKIIGGDIFYNREGNLPEKEGRIYYEADVDYEGGYRGPERIVFSNDGLIYYTPDHYDSFILLYGDE